MKAHWNISLRNIVNRNSLTAELRTKETNILYTAVICHCGKERPQQAVTGTTTMWVRHVHTHKQIRQQRHQTRKTLMLTWRAKLNAVLQSAYKVSITQFNDMQAIGLLHVFHPLVGLALGINHQRPPPGVTTNTHTVVGDQMVLARQTERSCNC